MKILILLLPIFLLRMPLHSQAVINVSYPVFDNDQSFRNDDYDRDLIKRNKVTACTVNNNVWYFDTSGRVEKMIRLVANDTIWHRYQYDSMGKRVRETFGSNKMKKPVEWVFLKTYYQSRLVCDSASPIAISTHWEYDNQGILRSEIFRSNNHIDRAHYFEIDQDGRRSRILDLQYPGTDTVGLVVSYRSLVYNKKGVLIREEESVNAVPCYNQGSAVYKYDRDGRLIEIERERGTSQKIKYYSNGLIASITARDNHCGRNLNSRWQYKYDYRP